MPRKVSRGASVHVLLTFYVFSSFRLEEVNRGLFGPCLQCPGRVVVVGGGGGTESRPMGVKK